MVRCVARCVDAIRVAYGAWRRRSYKLADPEAAEAGEPGGPAEASSRGRLLYSDEAVTGHREWAFRSEASQSEDAKAPQPMNYEMLDRMAAAAEAPLLVCLVISIVCHLLVVVLQLFQGSGHSSVALAEAIWHIWVAQLVNYTVSGCWLLLRLLNTRLQLSRSRPSLSGDLSVLVDSAPMTSRRYAHEAAVTHLAKVVIVVLTALLCLRHVGVNISKLLAVTSLSGVAVSFLAQDILANLFGGFVIYLTQPFAQGDWVQTPDGKVDGWIQNTGWYYTTVMRWEKRPHYIPNSTFSFMPIVNCSRMTHRRILIEGPLRMRDLDKVDDIVADVRNLIRNHNEVDKEMHRLCSVKKVEEFSVVLWVSCYIRNIKLAKFLQVQESVLLGICAILRKHNTSWASSLERFHAVPAGHGEADLTNEFRRLLNARSALLSHERDLDDREAGLAKEQQRLEVEQDAMEEQRRQLSPELASLRQRKELVQTRQQALRVRHEACEAKSYALSTRNRASEKLKRSIELFMQLPDDALELHQEALADRKLSTQMSLHAVGYENAAINTEWDSLKKEQQLLEHKLTTDVSPSPKSAGEAGAAAGERAGSMGPGGEGAAAEEPQPMDECEQQALAIGGE